MPICVLKALEKSCSTETQLFANVLFLQNTRSSVAYVPPEQCPQYKGKRAREQKAVPEGEEVGCPSPIFTPESLRQFRSSPSWLVSSG